MGRYDNILRQTRRLGFSVPVPASALLEMGFRLSTLIESVKYLELEDTLRRGISVCCDFWFSYEHLF